MDDLSLHLLEEYLYLGIWSFIGSVLGYFAFSNVTEKPPVERFKRCLISIAIGMFLAFPLFTYLLEANIFSERLSVMIAGLGAFGLPDFLLKHYPTLLKSFAYRVTKHRADHYGNRD